MLMSQFLLARKINKVVVRSNSFSYENMRLDWFIQLGQLRLNPPGLGSKCGKRVERFSDFGKYKGNFRNHTTSLPTYRTLSKWGKWVNRLSDSCRYRGLDTHRIENTQGAVREGFC